MLVICFGMAKSGSTLAFELTKSVLERKFGEFIERVCERSDERWFYRDQVLRERDAAS